MRILVTTDFSSNSRSAIKFAELIKSQTTDAQLIVYHAIQVMKPSTWSDKHFKQYLEGERTRVTDELKKFCKSVFSKKNLDVQYVVENSVTSTSAISEAGKRLKCDMICISTRGAGILRKLLGTNTEYLVNNSLVPVCAVPSTFKGKSIKSVTYLSDLENLKKEWTKASGFTEKIKSSLDIAHISMLGLDKEEVEKAKKSLEKGTSLNVINNKKTATLVECINGYVRKQKPDMLVMFTKRKKSFFESLFLPSKSAELTFTTKVPVLIFPK